MRGRRVEASAALDGDARRRTEQLYLDSSALVKLVQRAGPGRPARFRRRPGGRSPTKGPRELERDALAHHPDGIDCVDERADIGLVIYSELKSPGELVMLALSSLPALNSDVATLSSAPTGRPAGPVAPTGAKS